MNWVLGSGKDIAVDAKQLHARNEYIRRVTGVGVTDWQCIRIDGVKNNKLLCCTSDDVVDGIFITAHIQDVFQLCKLQQIRESKVIIANTCIWNKLADKELLWELRSTNPIIELYFAKQELSIDAERTLRQSTTLLNVGEFGFQTSSSERELFRNRRKGFAEALRESFNRVSPVLSIGE